MLHPTHEGTTSISSVFISCRLAQPNGEIGWEPGRRDGRLIAYFGDARLLRAQAGSLEVKGGTETDHADAWKWAQRFLTSPTTGGSSRTIAGWSGSEVGPPGSA